VRFDDEFPAIDRVRHGFLPYFVTYMTLDCEVIILEFLGVVSIAVSRALHHKALRF
jgi:hypothetical protein